MWTGCAIAGGVHVPCQRHREIATFITVLFYIQDNNSHTYFHLASGNLSGSLEACCAHVPLVPWTRLSSQLTVCRAHACAGRRSSRLCPGRGEGVYALPRTTLGLPQLPCLCRACFWCPGHSPPSPGNSVSGLALACTQGAHICLLLAMIT